MVDIKAAFFIQEEARVLSFQLSVGLALSYSVKPPQPGSLVGPVMKSTAIIPIRDRGEARVDNENPLIIR